MGERRDRVQRMKYDRQIIVRTVEGEKRIGVPKDAKITFGPAIPGPSRERGSYGPPEREYALRVYLKTKDNLIAVFTGVREFRDIEMPVEKLVIREAGSAVWKSDETGYKVEQSVSKKQRFVDDLHLLEGENPKQS